MANYAADPISGAGGYAAISFYFPDNIYVAPPTAITLTSTDWQLVDNSQYDIDYTAYTSDVTTSNSDGASEGPGGVVKVNSVSIQLPDDDPSSIDDSNLVPGYKYNLWLKRGTNQYFDVVVGAIFSGQSVSNNSMTGEDRKVTLRFEYGFLNRRFSRDSYPTYKGQNWAGVSCGDFLDSLSPAR